MISGASKIPTIIYYDQEGKVRAVGAEATKDGIFEAAEDGQWVKAEWSVHFQSIGNPILGFLGSSFIFVPSSVKDALSAPKFPLPLNKTVVQVFADFLAYMLQCASGYIQDTHGNGPFLWDSVKDDIHYVLSHPNGWEGTEQNQMRLKCVELPYWRDLSLKNLLDILV